MLFFFIKIKSLNYPKTFPFQMRIYARFRLKRMFTTMHEIRPPKLKEKNK